MSNLTLVSTGSGEENEVSENQLVLSIDNLPVFRAYEAATFFSRLRGLHAHLPIDDDEALVIRPCNSIHTFTMRKSIDVAFVSEEGTVIDVRTIPRWRFLYVRGAAAVIEMNAGVIESVGLNVGTQLTRSSGEWI